MSPEASPNNRKDDKLPHQSSADALLDLLSRLIAMKAISSRGSIVGTKDSRNPAATNSASRRGQPQRRGRTRT